MCECFGKRQRNICVVVTKMKNTYAAFAGGYE